MTISELTPRSRDAEPVRRFEIFTGAGRRREWPPEEKARIVAESYSTDETVCAVARRYALSPQQVFAWRRAARQSLAEVATPEALFVPAMVAVPRLAAPPCTLLDPGRGRTKTGQLWAYARDDRSWDGTDPPGVAYVYAPDRKAERPIAHLAGFTGILQVDGYGGYRVLADKSGATLAFCWAHVRRRFYEIAVSGPAPIASEALMQIAELYRIEDDIRRRPADERRTLRQEKSRPIVANLEPWLRQKLGLISQKTKLAEAIRYTLSRWQGLTRFLDDGRIEIDSNVVERSIRPIALNRKNALFAGSDAGAEHWAVIASLIETCKLNGVEPLGYIADVLTRIVNGHLNSRIDDLLPWAYVTAPELNAAA